MNENNLAARSCTCCRLRAPAFQYRCANISWNSTNQVDMEEMLSAIYIENMNVISQYLQFLSLQYTLYT